MIELCPGCGEPVDVEEEPLQDGIGVIIRCPKCHRTIDFVAYDDLDDYEETE